jgi:pyruvate/2-oxoacid:ferredoxin oxidoreductase alpha subunit
MPFPSDDFRDIASSVSAIGMIDRNILMGHGGCGFRMIQNALYNEDERTPVLQFHAGLSGKEVRISDLERVGEKILKKAHGESVSLVEWV